MAQFEPEEQFQLPIDYDGGNLAQQPKTTRAEIIANIDLSNPKNRREWTQSRNFREFYDIILNNSGEITEYVVCKKCHPSTKPHVFQFSGTKNLRFILQISQKISKLKTTFGKRPFNQIWGRGKTGINVRLAGRALCK